MDLITQKKCTKCEEVKSLDLFCKRKESKDGHRNECVKCVVLSNKLRIEQNPEKYKIWYENYQLKNKDILNQKRKYRYHNNIDGCKENSIIYSKEKYRENTPNKNCKSCNIEIPTGGKRIKFCKDCVNKKNAYYVLSNGSYKQRNKNWAKDNKDSINLMQNIRGKKKSESLTDGYIAGQIRGNKLTGLKISEIPKEIIETKRLQIQIYRQIKKQKS